MQLKKQAIRKMPTFDPVTCPHGLHRQPSDYNQKNNKEQKNRNAHGDTF